MARNVFALLLLTVFCATPLSALSATDPTQQLYHDIGNIVADKQACDSAMREKRWEDVISACGYEQRDYEHSAGNQLHRIAYFQKTHRTADADSESRMRNDDLLFAGEYAFYVALANAYLHNTTAARASAVHIRDLLASVKPSLLKEDDRIEGDTHLYQRYVSLRQHTDEMTTYLQH